MDTKTRLQEIDAELEKLNLERDQLERQLMEAKADKWSEEGLKERLKKAILSHYGSLHSIKMVKLMMNGVYDDNYNSYENPVLLIIDKDFNELKHNINPHDFCPSEEEQSDYMDRKGRYEQMCETVTLKF